MTLKKFVQGRIILIAGSMNELKLIFFMYINHDDEVFVQKLTSYFLNELPTLENLFLIGSSLVYSHESCFE